MAINLNGLGQIALEVRDLEASERFYGEVLGLRKLFRYPPLSFFDMSGVRLLLEQSEKPIEGGSVLYFRVADIVVTRAALEKRGLRFRDEIQLIHQMEDHDLWMTSFLDPDRHILVLMMEAPKGWQPSESTPH